MYTAFELVTCCNALSAVPGDILYDVINAKAQNCNKRRAQFTTVCSSVCLGSMSA